jgi:nitroreductase
MKCTIDITKVGNSTIAYLPFHPRTEFDIPKGTIYVKCTLGETEFKAKLMPKGNDRYCIFFSKLLLKNLGLEGVEHRNLPLDIVLDNTNKSAIVEPMVLENETLKTIRERGSIRSYTEQTISKEQIDTILNAGFCTPSATNKRPFHFVVTQNREKMVSITGNNPYVKMLYTAPACILVCGDKILQGIPEWLLADCSAATQNMLLAIHSLGLGGVWCGVKQGTDFYKDVVKEFELPSHIRPISLIPFGYPAETKLQQSRFEIDKVHIDVW